MVRLLARLSPPCRLLRAGSVAAALVLAGCVAEPGAGSYAGRQALASTPSAITAASASTSAKTAGNRIALLLPLTGRYADVGQQMLQAAQLALAGPGAPPMDQDDTAGTPEGAAAAARAAIAAGAGILVGPLTAPETAAVAPIARAAGIAVLAFTSDSTQAQPGVWTLGITPAQQMRRLVLAEQAENKTRLAAVVGEDSFGEALANGMLSAAAEAGMPPPRIVRTPAAFAALQDALKSVSDYDHRRGAIVAQQRAARARGDAEGRKEAAELGLQTPPPPPMDALLLGVSGPLLGQALPLLPFYDIGPGQLRILGPGTWARDAARLSALAGAWYAAPDPSARVGFDQQFNAKYGIAARDFATLAFDAAGIARAVASPQGFQTAGILRPEGFSGADGLLALQPDGRVRRGLAIFEIDRGGAHMVQPAPKTLSAPGV